MNRFPLSAVNATGYYYYRSTPEKSWFVVHVSLESCLISFFNSVSELDLEYLQRSRPQAELYGPLPSPRADAELDDQPLPF